MATEHQFVEVPIPPGYADDIKEAIALEIIDKIVSRTRAGKGIDNKPFSAEYSESYKNSLTFKLAGKSKSKVDLTLTGDMLDELALLSLGEDALKIGYVDGTEANAKADGNIRGTYGTDRADPSKARPFLGISDSDLQAILRKYPLSNEERARERAIKTLSSVEAADRKARGIETSVEDIEE